MKRPTLLRASRLLVVNPPSSHPPTNSYAAQRQKYGLNYTKHKSKPTMEHIEAVNTHSAKARRASVPRSSPLGRTSWLIRGNAEPLRT